MSATPTTAAPVANSVDKFCVDSRIWLCAGQNSLGIHCTALSFSQLKLPSVFVGDVIRIDRCAAARSAMGRANRTVTGIPTPTTSPSAGCTLATAKFDEVTAAVLVSAGAAIHASAVAITRWP